MAGFSLHWFGPTDGSDNEAFSVALTLQVLPDESQKRGIYHVAFDVFSNGFQV